MAGEDLKASPPSVEHQPEVRAVSIVFVLSFVVVSLFVSLFDVYFEICVS
jgi:hypothetical protein